MNRTEEIRSLLDRGLNPLPQDARFLISEIVKLRVALKVLMDDFDNVGRVSYEMAEKALRLNTDPARLKQLVQLLDSTNE